MPYQDYWPQKTISRKEREDQCALTQWYWSYRQGCEVSGSGPNRKEREREREREKRGVYLATNL